jgi:predicted CXXCH cytochrome family protein
MKIKTSNLIAITWALLGLVGINPGPALAATDGYAGDTACAGCHEGIYGHYLKSGHPFKIQKISGNPPVYPEGTSPGVTAPPKGMTWKDISFVIGGYGWKARFMDREGYILTGPENRQYNLANGFLGTDPHWTGYDAGKAPRKPYTCGGCHVTGWTATGENGPHQAGLPGIHGTWAAPGVTCEACHGPGAAHVADPGKVDLSVAPNCSACHVRGDVTQIDAADGLINHHEQYEDLLASPHRELACTTCHDPHRSTKYELGGFKGEATTCVQCHAGQAKAAVAPRAHRVCVDCHMPFTGKSAVAVSIAHKGGSVPLGDIRSHIHRINTDPAWKMFSDDGSYVRTDAQGRAFLTLDYTCLSCHSNQDKAWAAKNAKRIHGRK